MTEARTPPTADVLLQRAIDVIAASRPMPLSASVMIAKDEVLDLLQAAQERLPEELTHARWVLKERDEVIAAAHGESEAILREAQARAGQMVQRTEVVREANEAARRIVAKAEEADELFAYVHAVAEINRPGGGVMMQAPLIAATHYELPEGIPDE